MPGWIRGEKDTTTDEPTESQTSDRSAVRLTLTAEQKDVLIAEMLGDVGKLSKQVEQLAKQLDAMTTAITAADLIRWRNILDGKISELAEINLSQQAAARLQTLAQTYIEHLSAETNKLVFLQAKKAVADTLAFNQLFDKLQKDWLLRIATMAGVCFAATSLAIIVFK